ncbi:MAG: tetratricopeptide repeat protein [Deltaproteobacteria bacterium]|jgi:tetratricopeptide (TPR) repeat protein|nr:tetratricopeptide repeat protein [Deltaproteobacteria bacterium]
MPASFPLLFGLAALFLKAPKKTEPVALLSSSKPFLALLAPMIVFIAALAFSGCVTSFSQPLRPVSKIAVGPLNGPGAPDLERELAKKFPGRIDSADLILSGTLSFDYQTKTGQESVLPPNSESQAYPLTVVEAELSFDWRLKASSGAEIKTGLVRDQFSQVAGGFLLSLGKSPEKVLSQDETLKKMIPALAFQIAEEIGPAFDASDLESGDNEISHRALQSAASNDWDGAAALWRELLALNPEYAAANYNLGVYYERLGRLEEAHTYYRRAFITFPGPRYRLPLTRVTDALDRLGRPAKRDSLR